MNTEFDPEAFGIAIVIAVLIVSACIKLWPRKDRRLETEAAEMSAEREALKTAALYAADAEQLAEGMTVSLLDYADSLVPFVMAGMTRASAITKITSKARKWARAMERTDG